MPEQHPPSAFEEIFASPERPIIVGGQAVNLWAELYAQIDPRINTLGPFVSKDADILGTRDLAERLAVSSHWKLTNYYEPRTISMAMLRKEIPGKEPLLVEVIGSVNGLTDKDLASPDTVEFRPGRIYRVPSPVVLLKAKLANVATIDQARRQDVRHVRILIPCVCQYLGELLERTKTGEITERACVNLLEAARCICTAPRNIELAREHRFEFKEIFPPQLAHSDLEKIARFVRIRLADIFTNERSRDLTQSSDINMASDREIDIGRRLPHPTKERDFEIGD
jgi:hypothetical protein